MKIWVINGPNLNMLGIREPVHYGHDTYETLCQRVTQVGAQHGVSVTCRQSNHEGDLVDWIQQAYREGVDGLILNPGAYTHTSVALLDALKAVSLPAAEVHISRVEERETFRQVSYVREACCFTITGKGIDGYGEALVRLLPYCRDRGVPTCE